jgi:hypothetical protein
MGRPSARKTTAAVAKDDKNIKKAILYKCEPTDWLWMPKPIRTVVAVVTMTFFSMCFLVVPCMMVFLIPQVWQFAPVTAGCVLGSIIFSYLLPAKEWIAARKFGQLWYEVLDFSSNVSPEECQQRTMDGLKMKYIIGMHPHGIVPFHAILWAAYCDQYMKNDENSLYGFGAAADVVMYLPILRNLMGWLACGGASYKVLRDGIADGKCPPVNAIGRKPRNLYILPGGIAEVFTSTPGRNAVVFKNRYGLCRLSLETGAKLMPCYVFGGTDFFHNLATSDSVFSRASRKLKAGMTIFWGHFGLPIPFFPKVTITIADPIEVTKWEGEGKIPQDQVEALHAKYVTSIQELFDTYKAAAGYPDAVLEIE